MFDRYLHLQTHIWWSYILISWLKFDRLCVLQYHLYYIPITYIYYVNPNNNHVSDDIDQTFRQKLFSIWLLIKNVFNVKCLQISSEAKQIIIKLECIKVVIKDVLHYKVSNQKYLIKRMIIIDFNNKLRKVCLHKKYKSLNHL